MDAEKRKAVRELEQIAKDLERVHLGVYHSGQFMTVNDQQDAVGVAAHRIRAALTLLDADSQEGDCEIHVHVDGAIAKTNGLLLGSLFEKGGPFEGRCQECLNIGHTVIHYRGRVVGNAPCANGCPEREAPAPSQEAKS